MRVVLDSSSLAKRYVQEPGSEDVEAVLRQTTELGLCVICLPEVVSALNRLRRERALTASEYGAARQAILADVGHAVILQLTPSVIARSLSLLEAYTLRAMDSPHVACALEWEAGLFVSSDRRQVDAAAHAGLSALRATWPTRSLSC